MASIPASRYLIILHIFTLLFKSLTADSNSSFSLKNFGNDSNFESFLALYGDAKVVNGGSSLQLTAPLGYSAGRVVYRKPIKVYGGTPKKLVSISCYVSFSIPNGVGLAFVMLPFGYPVDSFVHGGSSGTLDEFLSVEFDDQIVNGSSGFVSVKVSNLSSLNLGLDGGQKLQSWIDYEAGSKRLEVRLNRFGSKRPSDPVIFVPVDLAKIWRKNDGFFVGLSSSNGNSSKSSEIHSWSFAARRSPDWMHSQPLDPVVSKNKIGKEMNFPKESGCVVKIVAALVVGIGCGVFGAFLGMFLWTVFGNRRPVVPEEFAVKSVDENDHKKLKIVLDKASTNEN